MPDLSLARRSPLERFAAGRGAALTALPAATRFVLRGRPAAIDAAEAAFGQTLPRTACRATQTERRAALWLGPDEWLMLAPDDEAAPLFATLTEAIGAAPHSLVDVSHRQVAIEISGPDVEAVLNTGCPLDLSLDEFPVGMCTRTIFGKSEIVLWRTSAAGFRVEVWRSFAAYVWRMLEEAGREFRV